MGKLTERAAKAMCRASDTPEEWWEGKAKMARAALRVLRREKHLDTERLDWLRGKRVMSHDLSRKAIDAAMHAERKARGGRA